MDTEVAALCCAAPEAMLASLPILSLDSAVEQATASSYPNRLLVHAMA
jgi:hypothetical protein